MSAKDQAWAERVGREAAGLGMRCEAGLVMHSSAPGYSWRITKCGDWENGWPDFRDSLTELACIAWVEDVARDVYGDVCLRFERNEDGKWWVRIDSPFGTEGVPYAAPTLAEACIAAVRAMKGGE